MDRSVYTAMAAIQREHWWYRGRRRVLADVIGRLGLPSQARLLEAGCGPGGNLEMLSRFGAVSAFEPDAEAVAAARAFGVAHVEQGSFPDTIPFDGGFDLAGAFDVVEHVDDDAAAVAALAAQVRPGGHVLLTVPAYAWLWSAHDERNHHRRRYTRPAIVKLLEGAGLVLRRATYFNSHLFPLVAAVRLGDALRGRGGASEEAVPAPWLNRSLETLFAAERFAVSRAGYPFGVSILAVGQRHAAAPLT